MYGSTGCVGAEFIPIVTIVADEVGDFSESLVRYDVWEGHGSEMGCFGLVLLLKEDFVVCRVGGRAGGREEVHVEVFRRSCWWAGTVSLYYVLSCGQERVMIFVWGGWGGHLYSPPLMIYWHSFRYSLALLKGV